MRRYKQPGLLDRVEKILMRLVIVVAVALVVVQTYVMDNNPITTVMAKVGSENSVYNETAHWSEPRITLYLENYSALPHLDVLINGNKAGSFTDRYLTVSVENGDSVEIDGTFYSHSIQVKVLNTSEAVLSPTVDYLINVENNIVKVDSVRLTH